MYLRLRDNKTVKKYLKRYLLCTWGRSGGIQVSQEEAEALRLCDGETWISEEQFQAKRELLQRFIDIYAVEAIDAPKPLLPGRAYREFDHRRRHASIWAITSHCDLDCIHCLYGMLHGQPNLSLEDAQKVIDHLADYGIETVGIFGGEPTIHPHFWEILDMIQASGMTIGEIDTHGMHLDDEFLERLKGYRTTKGLAISFDGLGTHDWMRNREGSEEATLEAIELACKKGFNVLASINVNRRTAVRMDETIDLLVSMGVRRIRLLATSKTPKWVETTAAIGDPTMPLDELGELAVHTIEQHVEQLRGGVTFTVYTQVLIGPDSTRDTLMAKIDRPAEKSSAWCPVGCDGVFVSSQGGALLCKGFEFIAQINGLDAPEYSLVEHTLDEALDTGMYREMRYYTRADVLKNSEKCQECKYWDMCYGGGCRACAEKMQESMYLSKERICTPDFVTCTMFKGGYMDRIAEVLDANPPKFG